MSASSSDLLSALDALSPVDGRYRAASAPLRGLLAERGLIRERIRVEAQWLLHLAAAVPQLPGAQFTPAVRECARQLASAPEPAAAAAVKAIEERINHDVKAVEYYVRERLALFLSKKSRRHGRNFERYTYAYFKRLGVYRLAGTVTWYKAAPTAAR